MEERDWRSTATLLRGALDRVERHIQDTPQSVSGTSVVPAIAANSPSTSLTSNRRGGDTARSEFDRLFGYRPDVSQRTNGRKRKGIGRPVPGQKRARGSIWKKETVCLRFKDQTRGPDTLEKMELAKRGLGLKDLSFSADGDALHIHSVSFGCFQAA